MRTDAGTSHENTTEEPDPVGLAEQHQYLIGQVLHRIASRFPPHVDRDDLHAAGAAGLVDAAHRYEPATGVPFSRYAAIRIRGSVLDSARSRDWATRGLRRDLRAIDAATAELQQRLHRQPDDAEVAAELGFEPGVVRARRAAGMRSVLLALDVCDADSDGRSFPLADQLEEQDPAWLPEPAFERTEMDEALWRAVEHLPDALRHVIRAHHLEGRLLKDIAGDLGFTEARVSQLRIEGINALRAYFSVAFPDVPGVADHVPGKVQRARFLTRVMDAGRTRPPGPSPESVPIRAAAAVTGC